MLADTPEAAPPFIVSGKEQEEKNVKVTDPFLFRGCQKKLWLPMDDFSAFKGLGSVAAAWTNPVPRVFFSLSYV